MGALRNNGLRLFALFLLLAAVVLSVVMVGQPKAGESSLLAIFGERDYSQEQKERLEHCSKSLVTDNIKTAIKYLLNDPNSFQWVEAERFRRSLSSTSVDLMATIVALNVASSNVFDPSVQWIEDIGLIRKYGEPGNTRTAILFSEDDNYSRLEGIGYPSTSLTIYRNTTAITGVNLWVAQFRAKNAFGAYVVENAGGFILSETCDVMEASILQGE